MTTIHVSFDISLSDEYESYYQEHPEAVNDAIRDYIVAGPSEDGLSIERLEIGVG